MKELKLTHNGTEYRLTYTRDSVRKMESQGLDIAQIDVKPMTMIPLLVRGAFATNHSNISYKAIDEIYTSISNKEGFIEALGELYANTVHTLLDDGKEGNTTWERVD